MGLGLLIVFSVLIFLVFLLTGFSWFFIKKEKPALAAVAQPAAPAFAGKLTTSEQAAVAMALHLFYEDVHDDESYVITIGEDNSNYKPWNSKIYGLNNTI
jgi:Na+-transporting methylmalonyl-CoA/oxaloacetate decarboxylase gamma subunit